MLRKRQGEADSKTGRVFREQTEGSPSVWRQALMSLSNEVERGRGKHSQSSVWLPSSQQDIKYSISTPSLVIWGMKLDSINTLSYKYRIILERKFTDQEKWFASVQCVQSECGRVKCINPARQKFKQTRPNVSSQRSSTCVNMPISEIHGIQGGLQSI